MTPALLRFRPVLAPAAGILLFLGERLWGATPARPFLAVLAIALLLAALAWDPPGRMRRSPGGSRLSPAHLWRYERLPPALFLLAAALYFGGLALPPARPTGPDWTALLGWGWALTLVVGAFLFLFIEIAVFSLPPELEISAARLGRAAEAGLSLALLLALVATLSYVLNRLPWQWDLTYFQAALPSEATRLAAEGLEQEVRVALFFSPDDSPLPMVEDYFQALEPVAPRLRVMRFDAELQPLQAKDFQVRQNGIVVVRGEKLTRTIAVGTNLAESRRNIPRFDSIFLTKLLEVSRPKRKAYFTIGHGERNETSNAPGAQKRGVARLRTLLEKRNFKVLPLGIAEGLGQEVPADAALVAVIAPTEELLANEIESLRKFLAGGGKLLVFLEPEQPAGQVPSPVQKRTGLVGLLAEYGLIYQSVSHANDRFFGRYTFSRADHSLLVTIGYQDHPTVAVLRRAARQFPLLLLGSGAWEKGKAPPGMELREVLKGMPGTWPDWNGNFTFDGGKEQRAEPVLALALSGLGGNRAGQTGETKGGAPRILAFADADLASDFLLPNRANRMLLAEGIGWLAGEGPTGDLPAVEEDVRLLHLKTDDWAWFYLPVFGAPMIVLALGYFLAVRPGRRPRGERT